MNCFSFSKFKKTVFLCISLTNYLCWQNIEKIIKITKLKKIILFKKDISAGIPPEIAIEEVNAMEIKEFLRVLSEEPHIAAGDRDRYNFK